MEKLNADRSAAYEECRSKFPPRIGNYYNVIMCEYPAFMKYASESHSDYNVSHAIMVKRLDISKRLDSGQITNDQAQMEFNAFMSDVNAKLRQEQNERDAQNRLNWVRAFAQGTQNFQANMPTQTSCSSYGSQNGFGGVQTNCTSTRY